MPDFFRNKFYDPSESDDLEGFMKNYPLDNLNKDLAIVNNYLESKGTQKTAVLGVGWGAWLGMKLSQQSDVHCGISWNPNFSLEKTSESQSDLIKSIRCPQMFWVSDKSNKDL